MEIISLLGILLLLIIIQDKLSRYNRSLKELQKDVKNIWKEIHQQQPGIPLAEKTVSSPTAETEEEPIPAVSPQPVEMPVIHEVSYPPEEKSAPDVNVSWWTKWLRDNPDIEKFIGENLVNKIGIAILILGIAFFVKYAIDQEWINQTGRVCIGLICGGILIGLAHGLRKNYHSFSSVLVGGGLTVFYFTIAFAFHQYQLIGQTSAFILMIIITAFAVILSLLYDRLELGVLSTIGGFITPFLVSTGEGNYVVLFTYLAILNAGLIGLAFYKRWRTLNFLAFIFTQLIYITWILNDMGKTDFPYRGIFVFGIVFYGMFVVMNVIHHVIRSSKLNAFDFIILLSVNLCFYGMGMFLLQEWGMDRFKGLFTAILAVVNLLLAYFFLRHSRADKNFIYLLIGLTLTYVSLTAPVQLSGHYITLFWSAEIVVLLWLYQKSSIILMKVASALITFLMLISLLMDWQQVYAANKGLLPIVFNKGLITGLFSVMGMLAVYFLLRKEKGIFYIKGVTNASARFFYLTVALVLLLGAGSLEINDQFVKRFPDTGLAFTYLQLYVSGFFALLFILLRKYNLTLNYRVLPGIALLVFVLYVLNTDNTYQTEKQLLLTGRNKPYFAANWISTLLLLVMACSLIDYIRLHRDGLIKYLSFITWIISIAVIILLSIEAEHLVVWIYYSVPSSVSRIEDSYNKSGLSIIWGVCSFVLIWLGMSFNYKPLRIIALVVFGVTLLKLFIADIRNINPAGKIVVFILLGILLLVISFMYQRLKKILIDDTPGPE